MHPGGHEQGVPFIPVKSEGRIKLRMPLGRQTGLQKNNRQCCMNQAVWVRRTALQGKHRLPDGFNVWPHQTTDCADHDTTSEPESTA